MLIFAAATINSHFIAGDVHRLNRALNPYVKYVKYVKYRMRTDAVVKHTLCHTPFGTINWTTCSICQLNKFVLIFILLHFCRIPLLYAYCTIKMSDRLMKTIVYTVGCMGIGYAFFQIAGPSAETVEKAKRLSATSHETQNLKYMFRRKPE